MHSDHAGCVEFFAKSQVIVHQAELDVALAYHQRRDSDSSYAWKDVEQWVERDLNWRFVADYETELSLSEATTLLNWGAGHAAGMLGLDVALDDTGHVILASDAIFTTKNFGPPARPPGYPVSAAGAARTVKKIRARAEYLNAQVWCGHDMDQFMGLRHSTKGWYE
jgi:glyoxylase-like metal-dependent hydrolase (beta-lactamase superfamily II)